MNTDKHRCGQKAEIATRVNPRIFSVRLICVHLCLSVAILLVGAVRADEETAIKELQKLGAMVNRDNTKPDKPIVAVFVGDKLTDKETRYLKELPSLNNLNVAYAKI